MMIGSSRDSMSMIVMAPPWNGAIDEAGLHDLANKQLGAGAETVLAAYRRSRPDLAPAAVAGAIVTGRVMTARTTELAERKAIGGDAPVFLYRWDYPAGMMGARHGGELPFVFKNIGKTASEGFGDWSEMEGKWLGRLPAPGHRERDVGAVRPRRRPQPRRASQVAVLLHRRPPDPVV
jgi:carboxylesterase type B